MVKQGGLVEQPWVAGLIRALSGSQKPPARRELLEQPRWELSAAIVAGDGICGLGDHESELGPELRYDVGGGRSMHGCEEGELWAQVEC